MKRVYFSLGSNLGDREANLGEALKRLEHPRCHILRVSSLYETEPIGVTGQPWFLNLAAEAETSFFPMMLLSHTQKVERDMGRIRRIDKGPRKIDVDILLYGHFRVSTSRLTIPHPRMHERRFVIEPMIELAPDLPHPVLRKTMLALFAGLKGQACRKLPPPG